MSSDLQQNKFSRIVFETDRRQVILVWLEIPEHEESIVVYIISVRQLLPQLRGDSFWHQKSNNKTDLRQWRVFDRRLNHIRYLSWEEYFEISHSEHSHSEQPTIVNIYVKTIDFIRENLWFYTWKPIDFSHSQSSHEKDLWYKNGFFANSKKVVKQTKKKTKCTK